MKDPAPELYEVDQCVSLDLERPSFGKSACIFALLFLDLAYRAV